MFAVHLAASLDEVCKPGRYEALAMQRGVPDAAAKIVIVECHEEITRYCHRDLTHTTHLSCGCLANKGHHSRWLTMNSDKGK